MTIETKYNIGDEVYVKINGEEIDGVVDIIETFNMRHLRKVYYKVLIDDMHFNFSEDELYKK